MTGTARGPQKRCPVLSTARLELGPHAAVDFPDMLDTWRDPVVVKYFGGTPSTPEECWTRLLRYAGLWAVVGFGYWRIRERGSGRFVGEVGLADFGRDITPSIAGFPEAGWVLASWAHGQGFAREAAEAIFGWADRVLVADRTVCLIDPANAPSLALAAKLGFQPFAETRYKGRDSVLLERLRRVGSHPAAAAVEEPPQGAPDPSPARAPPA
jgi:RimJ/RimL family protein N-acetyltransferase